MPRPSETFPVRRYGDLWCGWHDGARLCRWGAKCLEAGCDHLREADERRKGLDQSHLPVEDRTDA